jgi:hypothetical protein
MLIAVVSYAHDTASTEVSLNTQRLMSAMRTRMNMLILGDAILSTFLIKGTN